MAAAALAFLRSQVHRRFYEALRRRGLPVFPTMRTSELLEVLRDNGLAALAEPGVTVGELADWLEREESGAALH